MNLHRKIMILGLLLCTVFAFGQKYSTGKVPTNDRSRINPTTALAKGTKPNQVLMTLGDSTIRFVDSDTAGAIIKTYKVYTALLSQSGTSAPTAVVLENTLGPVTFGRNDVGSYYVSFPAADSYLKVFCPNVLFYSKIGADILDVIVYSNGDPDQLTIESYNNGILSDWNFFGVSLEIRVYN